MKRNILIAQILLTIGVFEFFGPLVKDTGASHLMNHEWVGHAKVHLAWLLGYMFFSGLANLYFIWIRKPFRLSHLYISALWQACHLSGFWAAVLLVPSYGGQIADPQHHVEIMGIDENIFAFCVLSIILIGAILFIKYRIEPEYLEQTEV